MTSVQPHLGLDEQRAAQCAWRNTSIESRLRLVRRLRGSIARRATEFAQTVDRPTADTLVAEVLPLAEACRFLEQNAPRLLAPQRPGPEGRPSWLSGIELEVHREPHGVVLIIGPANYPIFLPAVQAVQALVAGNAVVLKPGRGGWPAMSLFANCAREAGLPSGLFRLLDEAPSQAAAAIDAGVDKVFLTGSNDTGRAVLGMLSDRAIPSVMELSGNDPVFVLPGADIERVVGALRFGTSLNGGNTCIAPKRVIAVGEIAPVLEREFGRAGIALPLYAVADATAALAEAAKDPYALGATVFGPAEQARAFARDVRAGVVVVNDMIVPTADPRLPFGGRGASGFGVTRGAEGLLEMTVTKAICVRRSRWLPHLGPKHPSDADLFASFIAWSHAGSLAERFRALQGLIRAGMARRK